MEDVPTQTEPTDESPSSETIEQTVVIPSAQSEPTPTPASSATPVVKATKKSKKPLAYAGIGLLLICIGLGGGWLLFGKDDSQRAQPAQTATTTKASTSTASTTQIETALKPEDITAKVKTTLAAKYTLVDASTISKLQSGQVSYSLHESPPAYKTPGYSFYNSYKGGSTLYLTAYYGSGSSLPLATEVSMRSDTMQILTDFGLTKTDSYGMAENLSNVYTGKGVICALDDLSTKVSPTTLSCGLISAYKPAAEAVKPFADVLPDLKPTTILGTATITDSSVSGYQSATISRGDLEAMSGNAELFYRKTGGTWKYFLGTQSEVPCSKYDTTDLKNAYMGTACYDTVANQESTVK